VRGVAYLRVSTDEQTLGLEAQRDSIASYCEGHGIELVGEHVDQGVSGSADLERREGLLDAIGSVRRGWVLVVAKRDRLARDVTLAGLAERMVEKRGASVRCADGNGNGTGPADVLLKQILDAMAQFERAQIAMRTRAALRAKRGRGEAPGGVPPFGFRIVDGGPHPRSSGRRLSVLEESATEQLVLARMVALQDEGHGCSRIASALNAEGFLSPRTRKPWSRQGVWKVLRTAGKRGA
jgi:DNA invertase Pin-like site-specific DNA recombinase